MHVVTFSKNIQHPAKLRHDRNYRLALFAFGSPESDAPIEKTQSPPNLALPAAAALADQSGGMPLQSCRQPHETSSVLLTPHERPFRRTSLENWTETRAP